MTDLRNHIAYAIDEADNRWQHGIGTSGTTWEIFLAQAVLDKFKEEGYVVWRKITAEEEEEGDWW